MFGFVQCHFSILGYFAYNYEIRELYSSSSVVMIIKCMSWVKAEIRIEFS